MNKRDSPRTLPCRWRRNFAALGFFGVFLLSLFAGLVADAGAGTEFQGASVNTVGPALPFTIADFDGDLRPDLIDVHAGKTGLSGTQYWIELQLSAAGRQTIPVFAPAGGIRVSARDVNGDQNLDLVLTTTWFKQPVAILLNDGHGSFTSVDPRAFPNAFRENSTTWSSREDLTNDFAGVPPSSRAGGFLASLGSPIVASRSAGVAQSDRSFLLNRFLTSQSGRAPPSRFFLL